jgi:uncharacterized protein YhfF
MNAEQRAYLDSYLDTLSVSERKKYSVFTAGYFCADRENANICSELVKSGSKTATCSMKYWYESGRAPMPCVGELQVVTDWEGAPTSIIETTDVQEEQFRNVPEEFARAEGEGGGSFEWWREAHWNYFSRECAEISIEPSDGMILVLERFRVVYSPKVGYDGS